jgi:8-amino-7-oxononanoate synthase
MTRATEAYDWIDQALQTIHRANWHRSVQAIAHRPGAVIEMGGRSLLNFGSNDYLGLAGDDYLVAAAMAATQEYGTGTTGSRLVSGHRALHQELEQAIATLKQTEAALVFSSGYLANLSTVSALVNPRDLILADEYNHASLKNGAILSKATVIEYRHGSIEHLKQILAEHRHHYRRCLILTDSVFSMDGDLCPLPAVLDLAQSYGAMVAIDEAHATGVIGATGAGSTEHFDCTGRPLIQIGTLSKALGSLGGFVAGSAALIDFLRNRATGWIYTTGLSPGDTAAALAAIQVLHREPARRDRLWQNITHLKQQLRAIAWGNPGRKPPQWEPYLPSDSAIVCLPIKSPQAVMELGRSLQQSGIFAGCIRPPTVPTSRLRLCVMATHTPQQIDALVTCLHNCADVWVH